MKSVGRETLETPCEQWHPMLATCLKLNLLKTSTGLHTLDLARNSLAESIPALSRALPKSRIQDLGLEEPRGYTWVLDL